MRIHGFRVRVYGILLGFDDWIWVDGILLGFDDGIRDGILLGFS